MLAGSADFDRELIIWDNGSAPEFRAMLREEYSAEKLDLPVTLVEAPNLGARSALRGLIRIARSTTMTYCDDDVFFYPGWLQKHLEILHTYPRVGVVSGSPQRTAFRWGILSNLAFIRDNPDTVTAQAGRNIPEAWEMDFADSIGRNRQAHKEMTANDIDYSVTYNGVRAWAHGHHFQFMAYRNIIETVVTPAHNLVDNGHIIDCALDNLGLLRLTTYDRTTRHIGNQIDKGIAEVAIRLGLRK
jgi:hypothetical protein